MNRKVEMMKKSKKMSAVLYQAFRFKHFVFNMYLTSQT